VTQVMMTGDNMDDVLAKTPLSYPEYADMLTGV
jgi:hypothetical protein